MFSQNSYQTHIILCSHLLYMSVQWAQAQHIYSTDENEIDVHGWHIHSYTHACHTISAKMKMGKESKWKWQRSVIWLLNRPFREFPMHFITSIDYGAPIKYLTYIYVY